MTDRFDQMDKSDFDTAITKASQCTGTRDFDCAETQLRTARKLAADGKAKSALKRAEEALLAEKAREKEERRVIAQRQRDQEQQEERQRLAEQRARDTESQAQRQADERANLNQRVAAAGSAYSKTLQAQANTRVQEQARNRQFEQRQAEANAATARDQQRFAQERVQQQQQQQQRQVDSQHLQLAQQSPVAPVPARVERAAMSLPETLVPVATVARKTSDSINTGRRAMQCVAVTRDKEDIIFTNTCNMQIFVVWCGDLKYTKKQCGDGPAGNAFYTQSVNIMPGDKQYARGVGNYHYAACEGGISFGKDEIQDRPDGTFTCVPK